MTRRSAAAAARAIALGALLFTASEALAEPAFAVRTGYRCSQCHVNRTGGGMRTPFGSLYTQLVLPARTFRWRDEGNLVPADPEARFWAGADFRARWLESRSKDLPDGSTAEVSAANLYLLGRVLPGRLSLYLDETVAPGGASAREAFGLVTFSEKKWRGHLKAGKLLPAYGWRLPDDAAFIRQSSGFSYRTPDTGLEVGIEPGRWSLVAALTNGTGGDVDDDRSKRGTLQVVRRFRNWRLGVHGSRNRHTGTTIEQAGLLAGAGFGRLALLAEGDWLASSEAQGTTRRLLGFLEADVLVTRGLNLKLAHDWIDPDLEVSTDARVRDSLGVEYIPVPFVQVRWFARRLDGPPQVSGSRGTSVELELHLFF